MNAPDGTPIRITVPGEPQGKGRPRAFAIKHGARAGQVAMHTPAKTRTYEALIQGRAIEAMQRRGGPLHQALLLTLDAHCSVPGGWPAWKRAAALAGHIRPTSKPDLDNVVKAVADALNGVVWVDDSRVVAQRLRKLYAEVPRLEITVEIIAAQSAQDARRELVPTPIEAL